MADSDSNSLLLVFYYFYSRGVACHRGKLWHLFLCAASPAHIKGENQPLRKRFKTKPKTSSFYFYSMSVSSVCSTSSWNNLLNRACFGKSSSFAPFPAQRVLYDIDITGRAFSPFTYTMLYGILFEFWHLASSSCGTEIYMSHVLNLIS